MSKVISKLRLNYLGKTEKHNEIIEDHDFSDDLIGQIDYEITDYEESKAIIEKRGK